MSDLISHASQHPELSINQALSTILEAYNKQPQGQPRPTNPALLQMQQQGMNRMPNGPMMAQQSGAEGFLAMSPAMQATMLSNGSPHLAGVANPMGMVQSPAQSHMAPPMTAQQSQQGSNSGPSTNSSPHLQSKRRRSTAQVKAEDGSDPNGTGGKKVKQSPHIGGNKRVKQS
jgi:hypothetical protein